MIVKVTVFYCFIDSIFCHISIIAISQNSPVVILSESSIMSLFRSSALRLLRQTNMAQTRQMSGAHTDADWKRSISYLFI